MSLIDRIKSTLTGDDDLPEGVELECPNCGETYDEPRRECAACGETGLKEHGSFKTRPDDDGLS